MNRREQCEAIISAVEATGVKVGPLADELRALWAVKKAARRHCMRPGCGHTNEAMSDALDAYEGGQ